MKNIFPWGLLLIVTLLLHIVILSNIPFQFFKDMMVYPWLVHQGLVVYKDIALMYWPGMIFILLPYLLISGFSIASLQSFHLLLILFTDMLFVIACFRIFRSLSISACVIGFYLLWQPLLDGRLLWFETALTPLLILAYLEQVLYTRSHKAVHLVLCGIYMAVALLIKQNVFWVILITTPYVLIQKNGLSKKLLQQVFYIAAPFVVMLVTLVGILFTAHVFKDFFFWTLWVPYSYLQYYILWPTETQVRMLIPLILLVTISIVLSILSPAKILSRTIVNLTTAWIIGASLFAYPRFGLFHLQIALPFIALQFGYLILFIMHEKRRYLRLLILGGLFVVLTLTYQQVKYYWIIKNPGVETRTDADDVRLAGIIEKRIGSAKFFSLEYPEFLYKTLGRGPYILPWISMGPWLARLPDFDQKIISEIEKYNIPYIISVPLAGNWFAQDVSLPGNIRSYVLSRYRRSSLLSDTILEVYERK